MDAIRLNQLGYRPDDVKKAVIPEIPGILHEFAVFRLDALTGSPYVFNGIMSEPVYCAASGETVRIADFSGLKEQGKYKLLCGTKESFPFIIGAKPYGSLRREVLGFFRYQKCGADLEAGAWSHPACHTDLAHVIDGNGVKTDESKDVSGGWHDAGDYGRYILPAAQAVAQLLLGYDFAENEDADLLDVVWPEIEWMLKMQDNASGGVYHKVSCAGFNPLDEMPHDEHDELLLCPMSAESAAYFAGTMALASRFYPGHKERLLQAAISAWQWCMRPENLNAPNFENPPGITTGRYGGGVSLVSGRFWAACELFNATDDEVYQDYIKTADIDAELGWKHMGAYGILAYVHKASHSGDKEVMELAARMKAALTADADKILEASKTSPYGISLGGVFRWGSSMDIANNAMLLFFASLFNENEAYMEYAAEHVHYLLGKNALGQCYITGFGAKPVKNPHHRPSAAIGKTVPGMVSGGPNMNTHIDSVLHEHCAGLPPMKCFTDHTESFSSNEVTIYWNSPVYFMLSILGW